MSARRVSWAEALVAGVIVFGVIGTGSFLGLLAGFVAYIRTDESLWSSMGLSLVLSMVAATSVVGTLAWRFVVNPNVSTRWQGAVAGLIVGVAAHPLCWVFYSSSAALLDRSLLAGVNPVVFVFFATVAATFSTLLGLGWLSALLCALYGFFAADVRTAMVRRVLRSRRESDRDL